nr:hypothetical protein YJOPZNRJ_YJOPZNRJ_CDS_0002 [Microvirus sp.]
MKDNFYYTYDLVSHSPIFYFTASCDGVAVRAALPALRTPLRDVELRCVGPINDDGLPENFSSYGVVSWDAYKFPETKAEAVAPLNLSPSEIEKMENESKKVEK